MFNMKSQNEVNIPISAELRRKPHVSFFNKRSIHWCTLTDVERNYNRCHNVTPAQTYDDCKLQSRFRFRPSDHQARPRSCKRRDCWEAGVLPWLIILKGDISSWYPATECVEGRQSGQKICLDSRSWKHPPSLLLFIRSVSLRQARSELCSGCLISRSIAHLSYVHGQEGGDAKTRRYGSDWVRPAVYVPVATTDWVNRSSFG